MVSKVCVGKRVITRVFICCDETGLNMGREGGLGGEQRTRIHRRRKQEREKREVVAANGQTATMYPTCGILDTSSQRIGV